MCILSTMHCMYYCSRMVIKYSAIVCINIAGYDQINQLKKKLPQAKGGQI